MANKVVIFPESKLAAAQNYEAVCNTHYQTTFNQTMVFSYITPDALGQHVCPYYGPPWEFNTGDNFQEPPECAAARLDGVIHDTAVWPPEEM